MPAGASGFRGPGGGGGGVPGFGDAEASARGELSAPFGYLGMPAADDGIVVRAFLPGAGGVRVVEAGTGKDLADLPRIHKAGLFVGPVPGRRGRPYRLRGG